MKRFIITILIGISITANANDSLKIIHLQREVSNLKVAVSQLRQENGELQKEMQSFCLEQKVGADSLSKKQELQADGLNTLADKISSDLTETNKKIDVSANVAACGIFIALVLLVIIYLMLRKKIHRGSSSIDKIKVAQESLEAAQKAMQEESVKLDNKLMVLLDKQVVAQPETNTDSQPDHSLALKVADEIVRIETNLSRMDESVKGYKQLKKAVERIRTNFLANGYEIVEMLGNPYNEGMKVVANFVSDDTLAEGEQKITGIIKPQINYKGKMIQSAQITVSQNL